VGILLSSLDHEPYTPHNINISIYISIYIYIGETHVCPSSFRFLRNAIASSPLPSRPSSSRRRFQNNPLPYTNIKTKTKRKNGQNNPLPYTIAQKEHKNKNKRH
jgi:hypothetical protein